MATKFLWATCACVTIFVADDVSPGRPLEGHQLQAFEQKCEYHRLMDDGFAFAELRSSHLSRALAVKAVRRALYGSELNPNKGAEEDGRPLVVDGWMTLSFENSEGKRNIVFDGLGLNRKQQDDCIVELAKVHRENGHAVINRAPRGPVAEMGAVALFYAVPATSAIDSTFASLVGGSGSGSTEAMAQFTASIGGALSRLAYNNTLGGTVSHTVRTRINGLNGNLVVTQTSGAAGFGEDTVNSDSVSAGDELGLAHTDSGTNPQYSYIRTVFEASGDHATFMFAARALGAICDQTSDRYLPFDGAIVNDGAATEAEIQDHMRSAGTSSFYQVGASANAGASSRTFRFRKNNANGNQLVTFLAGATGIAIDSVNTDSIAVDDTIDGSIQPLLATDDITLFEHGCVFTSSSGTKTDIACRGLLNGGQVGRLGSATEHFSGIGGSMVNLTESNSALRQVRMGYSGRFSDPRCYISLNGCASDVTVRIRNNTTGQEISFAITAGVTGLYSNYGTTLDFGPDDDIFVGWVGGTSGTLGVASFEVTQEVVSAVAGFGPLIGGYRNTITGAGAVLQ